MSFHCRNRWLTQNQMQRSRSTQIPSSMAGASFARRLRVEKLEDRRLLAIISVQNDLDDSLSNLVGDGELSLREAIEIANSPGMAIDGFVSNDVNDTINFSFAGTINLDSQLPTIINELTIDGGNQITLDAGNGSDGVFATGDGFRILNIDDGNDTNIFSVTINGLIITGGDQDAGGGAIRSRENLSITSSTITGNAITNAIGRYAGGGVGIRYGDLYISSSTLSNNITTGDDNLPGGAISAHDGNITIVDSELSNNRTTLGQSQGGAIAIENGDLDIINSTVSGNSTTASNGRGGAIYAVVGNLSIQSSVITGNQTKGDGGGGGGIYHRAGEFNVLQSTISDNSTTGSSGFGGGVYALNSELSISRSSISDNRTLGDFGLGGGLVIFGETAIITDSEISRNVASEGGGIYSSPSNNGFDITRIVNSTLSGNLATGLGGGIYARQGRTVIEHSTITDNTAPDGFGSGIASRGISSVVAEVSSSIIADNGNEDVAIIEPAFGMPQNSFSSNGYNLIGIGNSFDSNTQNSLDNFNQLGDQVGILDPKLGPLADNGGPTQTHALLPGSSAINAGDSSILFDQNEFDQRGAFFYRVGPATSPPFQVIDIGAYEAQGVPSADFDVDGDIDGADFLTWQRGFGTVDGASRAIGNSDDDGDVDASDLAAWQVSYGQVAVTQMNSAIGSVQEAASIQLAKRSREKDLAITATDIDLFEAVLALNIISPAIKKDTAIVDEALAAVAVKNYTAFVVSDLASVAVLPREYSSATSENEPDSSGREWLSAKLLESVFG